MVNSVVFFLSECFVVYTFKALALKVVLQDAPAKVF
jgi:hypothetical protein